MTRTLVSAAFVTCLMGAALPAWAQFGGRPGGPGGMGPGMGPPPGGATGDEKEEGPAEEAPEEEQQQAGDLQPLGAYPGQERRTTKVIELNGYLRGRSDYFNNLFMSQAYDRFNGQGTGSGQVAPPPFPWNLQCRAPAAGMSTTKGSDFCNSKNIGGGNMRLRLEPTINVTDQVRVMAQIDVLDNLLLGSTPDSLLNPAPSQYDHTDRARTGFLSTTQEVPEPGQNGLLSSVRAKRAWGEVDTEFGSLRFGRMPWHFGRGIAFNNGSCLDCDYGTTVDRLMGLTQVYGHQVALAWDFGHQGHHVGVTELGALDPNGYPYDLSQDDDVLELMASITRKDDDRRFLDRASQGELMVNYGAQLVYRNQGYDLNQIRTDTLNANQMTMAGTRGLPTRDQAADSLQLNFKALSFIPSLWFKLAWKALVVEAETTGVFGKVGAAGVLAEEPNARLTLRQLGWVLATELRLAQNNFVVGFETGGATGDQAENPIAPLNYRWRFTQQPKGDRAIGDFHFSPDYHVDQLLFRRILGTVSNAVYVKPSMTYWFNLAESRQIGATGALIYSMAPVPVSTPGNGFSYGVELNLGLTYRNPSDGFFAGVTWAVLWPMGALNRPASLWEVDQDAQAAQALRAFCGIKF